MASQMVFSGTAGCPAFNPNPWKADICQVDDDDDDDDKECGFQLHLKSDICQVDADDDDDKGVDLKSDICKVDDNDDDDKGVGFQLHMKADICQVDDNDDRGVDEQIVRIKCYQALGKPSFKKYRNFMKYFHKTVAPPPPYCIYEILFQIFFFKFRDKIKIRQNSVNHYQSHPKFK